MFARSCKHPNIGWMRSELMTTMLRRDKGRRVASAVVASTGYVERSSVDVVRNGVQFTSPQIRTGRMKCRPRHRYSYSYSTIPTYLPPAVCRDGVAWPSTWSKYDLQRMSPTCCKEKQTKKQKHEQEQENKDRKKNVFSQWINGLFYVAASGWIHI